MTAATHSDNWLLRRIMKLTSFEKWLINSPKHARHTERTALALLEHVDLQPQPHCLEIGCGQGALARLLVERYGAQMVASDYDPVQVALARRRLADLDGPVTFRVVDARDIPFNDAEFDALFSFGVLHHIPGGWREAVAEIARVLKPGGWFIFTDLVVAPRRSPDEATVASAGSTGGDGVAGMPGRKRPKPGLLRVWSGGVYGRAGIDELLHCRRPRKIGR
jgi:SAM-dependent methyltransferase